MLTVISHVYNEEYLLPWWLEHHTKMFDHGVIIDYHSTDSSLQIIRDMAPHWEIVTSRVQEFDAYTADLQVMEIEQRTEGWKIALNTTEFLFHKDIKGFLKRYSQPYSLQCTGVYLTDPFSLINQEPDPNQPLLKQRVFGTLESVALVPGCMPARGRFLHSFSSGEYTIGRHTSSHPSQKINNLFCVWTGFAPMTQRFLDRKLQIRPKIPAAQIAAGAGISHASNMEELIAGRFGWLQYEKHIGNLRDIPDYNEVWSSWYD